MRISKDPEVRKQEIIDTAMKLFAEKGYEFTSMTDIAKEMNVVSGLCYRYFKSKEDLYKTAISLYHRRIIAQTGGAFQFSEQGSFGGRRNSA